MKAMLVLEHYGWGEASGVSPRPGLPGQISAIKARYDKPSVRDSATGQYVQPITDYRDATRSFNRGVRMRYVLESGHTYDVYAHTSWRGRERYRCHVTEDGEVVRDE